MAKSTPNSEIGGGSPGASARGAGRAINPEIESFSKNSSELTKAQNRKINTQNEAAKTYQTKDLAKSESAKKGAQTRKLNQDAAQEYAHNKGVKDTIKKAAAVGVPALVAAEEIGRAIGKKQGEDKPKGTQAGHAVTDNNNHTKTVSPADKQAQAKRPAVGNDKSAAKKANGPSWNNGYTN